MKVLEIFPGYVDDKGETHESDVVLLIEYKKLEYNYQQLEREL